MDLLEISGLPLHPLIVHAVVVLAPLTSLALVLGALFPQVRLRLGAVTMLAALVVLLLVPVTIVAGESLKERVGPVPSVLQHEALGRMLPPWAIALFVAAAAQWCWYRFRPAGESAADASGGSAGSRRAPRDRRQADRIATLAFAVLAVIVAVGTTTMVVLIGESGARSVWGG